MNDDQSRPQDTPDESEVVLTTLPENAPEAPEASSAENNETPTELIGRLHQTQLSGFTEPDNEDG
ncbi:hypothetical protein [Deinococcus peraridilitoris]|nr:hypothetical protein [Deinococcus peraridilitoris]